MPRIVDDRLGVYLERISNEIDTEPIRSIAWTMDPFAPVPEEYRHLVNDPNESDSNTNAQEEQ